MVHSILRGPKYGLAGLYSPGFPLLYEYFFILDKLMLEYVHLAPLRNRAHCVFRSYVPRLRKLFAEQGVTPELYATQWFITVFSYNLPFDVRFTVTRCLLTDHCSVSPGCLAYLGRLPQRGSQVLVPHGHLSASIPREVPLAAGLCR